MGGALGFMLSVWSKLPSIVVDQLSWSSLSVFISIRSNQIQHLTTIEHPSNCICSFLYSCCYPACLEVIHRDVGHDVGHYAKVGLVPVCCCHSFCCCHSCSSSAQRHTPPLPSNLILQVICGHLLQLRLPLSLCPIIGLQPSTNASLLIPPLVINVNAALVVVSIVAYCRVVVCQDLHWLWLTVVYDYSSCSCMPGWLLLSSPQAQ